MLCIILLMTTFMAHGQDGSDIRYVKLDELTEKDIGRLIHLDHQTRSWAFADYLGKKRDLSKIEIEIDGKKIAFREHRVDDGYNNWFKQQYMISEKRFGNYYLRLIYSRLTAVNQTTIETEAHFAYFDDNGQEVKDRSFIQSLKFKKSSLSEILINEKN